jgi:hypothetical protein
MNEWPSVDTPEQRQIKRQWKTNPNDPPNEKVVATIDVPAALEQLEINVSETL